MRAAIYARYSSDNQREASIDDQLRECLKYVAAQKWSVAEVYSDKAMSGATHNRPSFQAMLRDAKAQAFDILVAESLDRISRDQEHIAGLFKQLTFHGVRIFTLGEGEVNELHVGLKGTMNALFLKDLAAKIRRGQEGRVHKGRSPGGLAYGYRVVKSLGSDGDLDRGIREVYPEQAEVIIRIFEDYARGLSAKAIAKQLNVEAIPSPSGKTWNASCINGNKKRRDGILWNEAYIGQLIYNRQTFVKDPITGRRVGRPNPPETWVRVEVPELRIVSDEQWKAVQKIKSNFADRPLHHRRRPRRLLSGLCSCGTCGGAYTVIGSERMGCSAHRDRGTCDNSRTISTRKLESKVLNGLVNEMRRPEFVTAFEAEFRAAIDEVVTTEADKKSTISKEIEDNEARIERLLEALETGAQADSIVKRIKTLESRLANLESQRVGDFSFEGILLPTNLEAVFKRQLDDLSEVLNAGPDTQLGANDVLRAIFSEIVIHPRDGRGNIAIEVFAQPQMAWLAKQSDNEVMLKVVAEEGFEPPTHGL